MTSTYELDLKTLKIYPHIPKMNFLGRGFEKLDHYRQTHRHTDRCDRIKRRPITI